VCGRFVSTAGLADLVATYEVDEVRTEPLAQRFNVAPTQPIYAVASRRGRDGETRPQRQLGSFRWGLIPSWAKDVRVGARMINARAEGIATKPAFRAALVRRRCVIPADAFYEWQVQPPAADGTKRGRLPFAIRRADLRPLSFAGLWEVWRDPSEAEGAPLRSATIVTTSANDTLAGIHDRMPVVLADEGVATWLDPTVDDVGVLTGLLVPAPDEGWEHYPIGTRVNAVANEGPELLTPLV
jgi:putative SOS response-associated peptidase YedK